MAAAEPYAVAPISCCSHPAAMGPGGWTSNARLQACSSTHKQGQPEAPVSHKKHAGLQ